MSSVLIAFFSRLWTGLTSCLHPFFFFQVTGHFYQKTFGIFTWNLAYSWIDECRRWWVLIFFFVEVILFRFFMFFALFCCNLYICCFGYLLMGIWNDEALMENSIDAPKILKAEWHMIQQSHLWQVRKADGISVSGEHWYYFLAVVSTKVISEAACLPIGQGSSRIVRIHRMRSHLA